MAAPELEQLWQDPRHWTASIIYHCAADPRVIVPRQRRWGGWTLNFAHQSAWLVLLGAMAIALAFLHNAVSINRYQCRNATLKLPGLASVAASCSTTSWLRCISGALLHRFTSARSPMPRGRPLAQVIASRRRVIRANRFAWAWAPIE